MPFFDLSHSDSRPRLRSDRLDKSQDPTLGLPGAPPAMGEFMLPHATTFVGWMGSAARVYRPSDEALKNSRENARYMRNDPVVMECVEMRQRLCALLDWHLEPEDPKSNDQKQLCAELTAILERIPRFMQYRENLLHATFFGRYGIQNRWRWNRIHNKTRLTIDQWLPVHGDKIVWRYDEGRRDARPNQVGIRVGATMFSSDVIHRWSDDQRTKVEATDDGLAYFLDEWERPLLSVHKHFIEDGEWEDPWNAGRVHGHGLRSRLYWIWFQKQETLAFLMEYLERAAAGFELWYYPMHNPAAEQETRKAAIERSELGRNVILVPRPVGDEFASNNVERIEPGMGGVEQLKSLVTDYFGHQIKRYVLGQTLTTEADSTGLGSSLADVHLETLMHIIRYDATLLEETITTEVVDLIKRYNFPNAANIHIAFKIDTEQPDGAAKMEAFSHAFQMGLPLRAQELRDVIGAPAPEEGDETLSSLDLQKQLLEIQAQLQSPQSPPGMAPQPADATTSEQESPAEVARLSAHAVAADQSPLRSHGRQGTGERQLVEPSTGKRLDYRRALSRAYYRRQGRAKRG